MILRRKYPDWERPYKAPGGNLLLVIGMIVSVWIMVGSCLELAFGGYISLLVYCLIGVILYMMMEAYRKKDPINHKLITLTPSDKDSFN
jgi:APA family basic amino acid/polyamine antiporter